MTGNEAYLLVLGPLLALGFGAIVYWTTRATWSGSPSEQRRVLK